MRNTILRGIVYNGEPVYQTWNGAKTEVAWSSREVQRFPDGSRKFLRDVPLHSVELDRRCNIKMRLKLVEDGLHALLKIKGVERVGPVKPRSKRCKACGSVLPGRKDS
jgi:hypothetical protein